MARSGFLHNNQFISYPFVHGQEGGIPNCAIVDFGSNAMVGSGFIAGLHKVWLEWVRRLGNVIEFCFLSDAPGLAGQALIFQRAVTDPPFTTSFTWAQPVLSEEQLLAACECGFNYICNPFFDEVEQSTTTTSAPESSSSYAEDSCNLYPGSAVYGWHVDSGVIQQDGVLQMTVDPLSTAEAYQEVTALFPGETLKFFFDLVSHTGSSSDVVIVSLCGPTINDVLAQAVVTETGTHGLAIVAPVSGSVFVVIRALNTSSTNSLVVELDNVTLQSCISNSSSYSQGPPDPTICPADSVWEGYLVTGDISCLLNLLVDCTRAGIEQGTVGEADILFLTDTTGSMVDYINTVHAVFSPLATSVTSALPTVSFQWASCSYKDFEDGGNYTLGINVEQSFTDDISAVSAALPSSAAGGGDTPEQQLASLKLVAETWLGTLGGRPTAQKAIIWGGDVIGWENGAKGYPYPSLTETVLSLRTQGVKVFAINQSGAGAGLDGSGSPSNVNQASTITSATGGVLTNNVQVSDADEVAAIVAAHIINASQPRIVITYSLLEGPAYVEPTLTQTMDNSYVRSLAVVNAQRTRADRAAGCRDYCWDETQPEICLSCECVAGNVRFTEGYNTSVRVDSSANAIVIEAEYGAGAGVACAEIPTCLGELPPIGRTTLSGAPTCSEVVRSINGSGRRFFEIAGGQGVSVTAIPEQHRIIIDVNFNNMALCQSPQSLGGSTTEVDILFLMDTTISMSGYIDSLRAVYSPLADTISALMPAVDFHWAVCSYKDFEDAAAYSTGVQTDQVFTADTSVVAASLPTTALGGGDAPEQQLAALKRISEMWTTELGGRTTASKIIVWGGDASAWESGAKGFAYPALEETIQALQAAGIRVFAISPLGPGQGIDTAGEVSVRPQASAITAATGGSVAYNVSVESTTNLAETILAHITAGVSPTFEPVECIEYSTDPCDCGPVPGTPSHCPDYSVPTETYTYPVLPDPRCTGSCTWQWVQPAGEAGSWVQLSGDCSADCSCSAPTAAGVYNGELQVSDCFGDIALCIVANNDFESVSRDESGALTAVTSWLSSDTTRLSVQNEAGGLLGLGNVVQLTATEDGHAELWQEFAVTPGNTYEIEAFVDTFRGDCDFYLTSGGLPLPVVSEEIIPAIAGSAGQWVVRTYTVPVDAAGHAMLLFRADNKLTFTGRGLLYVAHVCVTDLGVI